MERIETVERLNEELLKINRDLRNEIAKRDQAIQEAVVMICELEEKVIQLERVIVDTRPDLSQGVGSAVQSQDSGPVSVPLVSKKDFDRSTMTASHGAEKVEAETRQRNTSLEPGARVAHRQPSFLSENKQSTSALRSLFAPEGALNEKLSYMTLPQPGSLFSGYDDEDPAERDPHLDLKSPALSVLSKSSFVSVYGNRDLSPPKLQSDDSQLTEIIPGNRRDAPQRPTDQRSAKVREWLDDHVSPPAPATAPRVSSNQDVIPSINEILHHTPAPAPKLNARSAGEQAILDHISAHQLEQQRKRSRSPAFGGPMFDDSPLPPTPDTLYRFGSGPIDTASTENRSKDYVSERTSTAAPEPPLHRQTGYRSNYGHTSSGGAETPYVPDEQSSVLAERSDSEGEPAGQDFMPHTEKISHSSIPDTFLRPTQNLYATNLMFDGTENIPLRPTHSRQSSQHPSHKSRTPDSSYQDLSKISPQEWLDTAIQATSSRQETEYNENRNPAAQHYRQLVTPPRNRSERPRQRRDASACSSPSEPYVSPQKHTTQDEPRFGNQLPPKLTRVRSNSFSGTIADGSPSKSVGSISATPSKLSTSRQQPNSFKAPLYPPRRYSSTGRGQSQTRPSSSTDHYSPQDPPSSYASPSDSTHKSSRRGRHAGHAFDDGMTSGEEGMMTPPSTGANTASNSDLGYGIRKAGSRGQLRSESGTSLPRIGTGNGNEQRPQMPPTVSRTTSDFTTRPASVAGFVAGSTNAGSHEDRRRMSQIIPGTGSMNIGGSGSSESTGAGAGAGAVMEKDKEGGKRKWSVNMKGIGKMGSLRGFRKGSRGGEQGGGGGGG